MSHLGSPFTFYQAVIPPMLRVQEKAGGEFGFLDSFPFPYFNFIFQAALSWMNPAFSCRLRGSHELTDLPAGSLQRIPGEQFAATLFLIYIADPNDGLLR